MMVQFTVQTVGDKAVIGKLDTLPERLRSALHSKLAELSLRLQAVVQREKLQGQVLQHRTGKLSASIEQWVREEPDSVLARVFSNGTAPYAAIHEFGFDGSESVRSFTRRQTMVFGRPIVPITVTVGAFDRHMTMPERSFLRSTLAENAAMIERELTKTVIIVVGEGAA